MHWTVLHTARRDLGCVQAVGNEIIISVINHSHNMCALHQFYPCCVSALTHQMKCVAPLTPREMFFKNHSEKQKLNCWCAEFVLPAYRCYTKDLVLDMMQP